MGCGGGSSSPPGGSGGGRIDIILPLITNIDSDGVPINVMIVDANVDSDGVPITEMPLYTRVKNFR